MEATQEYVIRVHFASVDIVVEAEDIDEAKEIASDQALEESIEVSGTEDVTDQYPDRYSVTDKGGH